MASWRLKHPSTLAAIYALNGNALDGTGRYPGTLVNTPTWGTFLTGRGCIELDGNDQHVNCGDVAELNAVSAFSICFWMNQDVLDAADAIFEKYISPVSRVSVRTTTGGAGLFIVYIGAGGVGADAYLASPTYLVANNWHHMGVVFDGSGAANADRLMIYVDGVPITLAFDLVIPSVTDDLSGIDATIGAVGASFDGELYDFRIASCALSRDEIISIIHEAVPV